jgi:hypothetical protein
VQQETAAVDDWRKRCLGRLPVADVHHQVDGRRKRGPLVDFDGGSITGDAVLGSFFGFPFRGAFWGDITPAQVSVPEPAALGMFGAGALLLGLFAGLRRRYD